jgi:hypothetical protein
MHCTPAISIRARLFEMNAKQRQNVIPVPCLFTRPHTEEAHLLSIQYGARSKHDMS